MKKKKKKHIQKYKICYNSKLLPVSVTKNVTQNTGYAATVSLYAYVSLVIALIFLTNNLYIQL